MSTAIERCVYGGRGLTRWSAVNTESEAVWPEQAYEAVRAINHLTGHGHPVPAPVLYDVLGNLKGVGHLLPQALTQLGDALARSRTAFIPYDVDGEPAVNIRLARQYLAFAAGAAADLGSALEAAQGVVAGQGYRDKVSTPSEGSGRGSSLVCGEEQC